MKNEINSIVPIEHIDIEPNTVIQKPDKLDSNVGKYFAPEHPNNPNPGEHTIIATAGIEALNTQFEQTKGSKMFVENPEFSDLYVEFGSTLIKELSESKGTQTEEDLHALVVLHETVHRTQQVRFDTQYIRAETYKLAAYHEKAPNSLDEVHILDTVIGKIRVFEEVQAYAQVYSAALYPPEGQEQKISQKALEINAKMDIMTAFGLLHNSPYRDTILADAIEIIQEASNPYEATEYEGLSPYTLAMMIMLSGNITFVDDIHSGKVSGSDAKELIKSRLKKFAENPMSFATFMAQDEFLLGIDRKLIESYQNSDFAE